jgi:beta-mannosidase
LSETWKGSVRWSLETLDGKTLEAGEEHVTATPFDVTRVCHLDFSGKLNDDLRREVIFIAELGQGGQFLFQQTAYFVPTKHLALTDPGISTKLRVEKGQVHIELSSRSLARLVECALDGADVVFSDNYFDLPAGRAISISAPLPAGWTPSQVQTALKIHSVYDSYAHGAAK